MICEHHALQSVTEEEVFVWSYISSDEMAYTDALYQCNDCNKRFIIELMTDEQIPHLKRK